MIVTDKFHFMSHYHTIVQLFQHVVYQCCQYRIFDACLGILYCLACLFRKISEPFQERDLMSLSVIDQKNIELISLDHSVIFLNFN